MKIILGTRSLLKKNAVQEILDKYSTKIDIENITLELKNVGSNVPETPYNDQAYEGAKNRAYSLRESINEKDTIYVGIESAIAERVEILFEECWTVIVDHNKNVYAGYSSGFMLPNDISIRMKNGESHINVICLTLLSRPLNDDLKIVFSPPFESLMIL